MAMKTNVFDSEERETALAKVLCPTSYGKSIYLQVPIIGKDRRSDGGAKDMGGSVDFERDIWEYERGDYVTLVFEPCDYSEKHVLSEVRDTSFTDPINANEEKFPNTDIPVTCPSCGRDASALVKTELDSDVGGKVSNNADACAIDPNNRGSWFGFSSEWSFVH